jgi:hypothetical protein
VVTPTNVDQSGATADGDIIAGDKHTHEHTHQHHHSAARASTLLEQLMRRLADEMRNDQEVRDLVEGLQRYYIRRSADGIEGLEAKLKAGNRSHEILDALEQKERFVKLLDRWALYASAQEIFAFLLAKAEHEFRYVVLPQLSKLDEAAINKLIAERIIYPLCDEVGAGVFTLDAGLVIGMLYWLAEQCFVRWHQ